MASFTGRFSIYFFVAWQWKRSINCTSGRVHVNLYLDFSRAYLDTGFVDILFRVPQCYLFRRRTFLAVTVLKFLQKLALDFPYIWVQFFPRNFAFELNFGSFYNENNGQISAFRNEKGITEISENIYIYIYIYIHPFSRRFSYREIYREIYTFVFLHVRPCAFTLVIV